MTGIEHRVLPIRLEGAARPLPLLAAFTYRCERPYELTLDFQGGGRRLARWVFSRDLLLDGESRATGEGDIRVWPGRRGSEPRVCLSFEGGGRSCVVSARAKDVRALCRRLVELVPRGEEQRHYDLDAGLSGLLSR
ncbi:SsgA family sporulation/cell division regulator [Streptomyces sp. NPDC032472]|uniref:SsgA family sporulation/cell division regulator n=1 Tax=Streptomyces sp. NPDC032472 TaxID=3155018 RepID=UPI0033D3D9A4